MLAVLCWVLAVVAGFAAIGLTWTAQNVRSESGYVALTSELAADPDLQENVAAIIAERLVSSTGLDGGIAQFVSSAVQDFLRDTWTRDDWREAWELSQASSHAINFDDSRLSSEVIIDVSPMAQLAVNDLTGNLPVELRVPASMPINTGLELSRPTVTYVERSAELSIVAIALTVVFSFLTLVVAQRRVTAIGWLGVGAILVAAAWWLGVTVGLPRIIEERVTNSAELAATVDGLAALLGQSLRESLVWVAVGGGAAVVVALIGRAIIGEASAVEGD